MFQYVLCMLPYLLSLPTYLIPLPFAFPEVERTDSSLLLYSTPERTGHVRRGQL
jgi:hypothetical protein